MEGTLSFIHLHVLSLLIPSEDKTSVSLLKDFTVFQSQKKPKSQKKKVPKKQKKQKKKKRIVAVLCLLTCIYDSDTM